MAKCKKCSIDILGGWLCKACHKQYNTEYRAKKRDDISAQRKNFRKNNVDKIKETRHQYYKNNSDKIKKRVKAYVDKNYDLVREQHRKNYQGNIDHRRRKIKEWQLKNPEKVKELQRVGCLNRIARKKNAPGKYTIQDVRKMYDDQNGKCNACQCDLLKGYHVDHMIPLIRGGSNWPENLQLLCPHCNCTKHTSTMEEFMIKRNHQ